MCPLFCNFAIKIAVNWDGVSRETGLPKGNHIVGSIPTSVSGYLIFIAVINISKILIKRITTFVNSNKSFIFAEVKQSFKLSLAQAHGEGDGKVALFFRYQSHDIEDLAVINIPRDTKTNQNRLRAPAEESQLMTSL